VSSPTETTSEGVARHPPVAHVPDVPQPETHADALACPQCGKTPVNPDTFSEASPQIPRLISSMIVWPWSITFGGR
jgi:hypothetical protein